MMQRFLPASILGCLLLLATAGSAAAQHRRPAETFFMRLHAGLSSYVGDQDKAFFASGGGFPYNAGVELGYQFTHPLGLGVGYQIGNYPGIDPTEEDEVRHTLRMLLRYTVGDDVGAAPYLQTGAHATFGKVLKPGSTQAESETAFGALFGLGVDIPLSNSLSLFFEATTHPTFPDDAADGREDDGGASFDLLTTLGGGLKINFRGAFTAPRVLAIDGPATLETGQPGAFTAATNENRVSRPVDYRWDWGDGTSSVGLTASHSYTAPGTYTVRFTASNRGGSDSRSMSVRVVPRPVPAAIIALSADPQDPDTCTPVRFRATVRGDTPLTYDWTFGDQQGSGEPAPTHTYRQPGTYTVTLNLANASGADTRTMSIIVRPYEAEICSEITEMSPAFFDSNNSTLTEAARSALRENLEILRECPNMNVRLEGYAAPGERNPQRLSEDRARAVEQFYATNGVAATRMITIGRGRVPGTTSKKEGAAQWRRVDTIPLR